jgi:Domain of unknown function (DUF4360)
LVLQQAPKLSLAAPKWSKGCVTSIGPPQVTFSPDQRVVTFILQNYRAEAQGKQASRSSASCRLTFDLRLQAGFRASFASAQYAFSMPTMAARPSYACGTASKACGPTGRRDALFRESPTMILSVGKPPKTRCGGTRRLVVDLEVRAASPGPPGFALAEVTALDLDAGIAQSIVLERC